MEEKSKESNEEGGEKNEEENAEQPDQEESITDIQNYLASFNQEIADGSAVVAQSSASGDHAILSTNDGEEEGEEGQTTTYYVARTTDGQTYQYAEQSQGEGQAESDGEEHGEATEEQTAYIAVDSQPVIKSEVGEEGTEQGQETQEQSSMVHPQTIRMLVRQPDGTETEQTIPVSATGGSTLVTSDGQEIHMSDEGTLQMMASLAEQSAGGEDGNNQVILNTGNAYQTVTIVPSDTNPGEVSYVLIVSQPEDKEGEEEKEANMDMSVYDFNEGGEKITSEVLNQSQNQEGVQQKVRTIKITPKKSQTVTQAHMCNYCNYTSPKRYLLSRHMKSHSEERPHKCSVCERGFKTLASLQNHVNTHTGTRPHQCKECEAAFTTSGELVRHVRYKHTHEKPHRCTECDYASVELSKLKRHMRCHTGERPYQCPHCTYASPDTYKLKRHLRIHTGEKPYECDICHSRFTQSNSLKAHKLIHSGNKPVFQCELCPTTCGRKTDLRIHVQKLHTSDKPLKCKRCGKSFPDRYTYKVHVKTHEGEKCFKCDLCAYASISQRHLESHMLIHTDQKPYRCDECGQSFRQKQLLKRHKNLYHDPNYIPPVPKEKTHECPECNKQFRHKGNLIRHLAVHDPDATAAEKEEAMRIGRPKGPGEEHDGEEDDYIDDEEMADMSLEGEEDMNGSGEGQQVVVFEVIQLPASEGGDDQQNLDVAAMTMAANGQTSEGVTIIQPVSGTPVTGVITPNQSSVGDYVAVSQQSSMSGPRRRGRPRKHPMGFSAPAVLSMSDRDIDSRPAGRRRRSTYDDDPDFTLTPKRGRPKSSRGSSRRNIDSEYMIDDETMEEIEELEERLLDTANIVVADPEEVARREKEKEIERMEQKEKDMAECFGFNDDDEDDDEMSQSISLNGPVVNGENSESHEFT